MVAGVSQETGPSACHPFPKSRGGGTRFVSGKGAEGCQSVVAKDMEPLAELGEINPQEVSDVFWGMASCNSQDGGETLVDTPIKCFLAAAFDFLALFSRQDNGVHA
jgi:hypothetical protein